MKLPSHIGCQFLWLLALGGTLLPAPGLAQSSPAAAPQTAVVRSIKVLTGADGLAVEIIASRRLKPAIAKLDGPPRLVIDLPNASFTLPRKRYAVRSEQVSALRVDQFQKTPPVTRLVVDLLQPVGYTWESAQDGRLLVQLHPTAETVSAREPAAGPAFRQGAQPAATHVTGGASGGLRLADSHIAPGSSVSAGSDTAILHLARGGEVRVCAGTRISVASSPNGRDLMLAMSTGALEVHYRLSVSADSVLTPDFRILLAGPGEFHYAISADSRGNTCVRGLPGNGASVIVSALMSDGTYQVRPSEQVVFRGGRLELVDTTVPEDCGCPPPAVPVLRASAPAAPVVPEPDLSASLPLPGPSLATLDSGVAAGVSPSSPANTTMAPAETAPPPPSKPGDVHVQVEAPFIFRAADQPPPAPDPKVAAETVPMAYSSLAAASPTVALPPSPAPQRRGFLGKMKGFFAAMFR